MTAGHLLFLLGALLAIGCSDSTGPARLDGSWTHDYGVSGNALSFTLTTQGDVVSGSGTWAGEACCGGPVTITGTDRNGAVDLDFAFTATGGTVPNYSHHFSGRLVDSNTLAGDIRSSDTVLSFDYQRVR